MSLIRLDWNRYVNTDEISDITFKNTGARIRFKDGRSETLEYFSEENLTSQLRPAATILPCPTGLQAIIALEDESGKLSHTSLLPMVGLLWVDDAFTPACLETMPGNSWAWRFDDGRVLSPEDAEFVDTDAWLADLERTKNIVAEHARRRKENDTKNDTPAAVQNGK